MPFPASLMQTLNDLQVQLPSVAGFPQPITILSISHFLYAICLACLLLVSFTGWGRMSGKLLRLPRLPVSIACSLGIAVIIFLGGFLNLLHLIYPAILFALVVFGLFLYFALRNDCADRYRWRDFWYRCPRWAKLLVILALVTLALRVAATVRLSTFNSFDDGPAYMVFPQKMLAAHHFAFDPFSDRRIISSLGGAYLLQAMVIAATSLAHIGMADRTLGLLLLFPAIFDLGIAFDLSPIQIGAMEWVIFLVPQETWNLTFVVLPIPLLLSIIWVIFHSQNTEEGPAWRLAILAGVIGGAVLSLKSSFLPYLGTLIIVAYVLLPSKRHRDAINFLIIEALGCLLVMGAWMISMKHESGTFLFPVLGRGVDYSSYGLFEHMSRFTGKLSVIRSFVQGIALVILACIQFLGGIRDRRSKLSFSVLIAAACAITVFNFESGGDYIWRYNFAQFFTAIILFCAAGAAVSNHVINSRTRIASVVAMLSLVACIFYYDVGGASPASFRQIEYDMAHFQCGLRASLSGQALANAVMVQEYRAVEASFPPGSTALESLSRPFLFDYAAGKTILLADWPGGASPPPGWNFNEGGSGLAQYLTRQHVQYLVYDHQSVDSLQFCRTFANLQHYSQLDHKLELLAILAHHQFDQIRATHKVSYDDGKIAVVDLSSPVSSNHPVEPAWTLDTSETDMCSQIVHNFVAIHAPFSHQKQSSCE